MYISSTLIFILILFWILNTKSEKEILEELRYELSLLIFIVVIILAPILFLLIIGSPFILFYFGITNPQFILPILVLGAAIESIKWLKEFKKECKEEGFSKRIKRGANDIFKELASVLVFILFVGGLGIAIPFIFFGLPVLLGLVTFHLLENVMVDDYLIKTVVGVASVGVFLAMVIIKKICLPKRIPKRVQGFP